MKRIIWLVMISLLSLHLGVTNANGLTSCPDTWSGNLPNLSTQIYSKTIAGYEFKMWALTPYSTTNNSSDLYKLIIESNKTGELVFDSFVEVSPTKEFGQSSSMSAYDLRDLDPYMMVNKGLRDDYFIRYKISVRARNCPNATFYSDILNLGENQSRPLGVESYIKLGKSTGDSNSPRVNLNFEEEESVIKGFTDVRSALTTVKIGQNFKVTPISTATRYFSRALYLRALNSDCGTPGSGYSFTIKKYPCLIGIFASQGQSSQDKNILIETVEYVSKPAPQVTPTPVSSLNPKITPSPTSTPSPNPTIKCRQEKTIYMVLGSKCPKGLIKV